jgi:hypothetical protein
MRRRGVVGRYCQFVATRRSFLLALGACWRHGAMMNNEKVPLLQGSAAQIQGPHAFPLLHPTRCADAGTHLSARGARTLECFQVVGKTARCHWRFPLALHILLHPNRQRSGVQCLKDVRISSVPPAGALGLIDDSGNAKCGPSFSRPDPASSEEERTARGRRDMSCRFPGPLRLLGWALTHASRLKLRSRLC